MVPGQFENGSFESDYKMRKLGIVLLLTIGWGDLKAGDDKVAQWIETIRSIGAQGSGSQEARAARIQLAGRGPEILLDLLVGMDTPDIVSSNWLRSVFDEIVDRTWARNPKLIPEQELRDFFIDSRREGRVRRLALSVLARRDPEFPERMIPGLVEDPEFRFDAIDHLLKQAKRRQENNESDQAVTLFQRAFEFSRDENQIRTAADQLADLGQPVSIVDQLGYILDWYLIGPFHGPGTSSFGTVYPPEKSVDLQARYMGKLGEVSWKRYRTEDTFGTVNLVDTLSPCDEAAAYAFTVVTLEKDHHAQFRCGADDNLSIWLNDENVFAKEEWKNGTRFDRFRVNVKLKKGRNRILVKICQGTKYSNPELSNLWSVQMRICESDGKGVTFGYALPEIRKGSQLNDSER